MFVLLFKHLQQRQETQKIRQRNKRDPEGTTTLQSQTYREHELRASMAWVMLTVVDAW